MFPYNVFFARQTIPRIGQKGISMEKITRRALIRIGSIAVSAVALTSCDSPETAAKENENGNVFHVFAFRWKPNTSEATASSFRGFALTTLGFRWPLDLSIPSIRQIGHLPCAR